MTAQPHNRLARNHDLAVTTISQRVKHFHAENQPFRIYHGSTNSTRVLNFDRERIVDTSSLDHVLHVDTEQELCVVEPNVRMDTLVDATLRYGLVPKVVMELRAITVGGGFSGTSGESSSYRFGFFEDIIQGIEIVLGDGSIVNARRRIQGQEHEESGENEDLLEAAAGSFGTFGVVTKLEVALMKARKYVSLEVRPRRSVKETIDALELATEEEKIDYVDGILFGNHLGVVMVGKLTDEPTKDAPIVRFSRARDQWFYRYVEKRLDKSKTKDDWSFTVNVPIVDYYFRYDRGAFWGGKWVFKFFYTPFNRVTRFILDPLLHTQVMFHALHESGLGNQNIIQDIGFPRSTVEKFIEYIDHSLGLYPLWLCPLKKGNSLPLRPRTGCEAGDRALREELLVNVGIWGPGPRVENQFVKLNRDIEKRTKELYGAKCLYARAYYTEDEFWSIYDRTKYDALREKYHAKGLPSVCEKVNVNLDAVEQRAKEAQRQGHRPKRIGRLSGLYGATKAWMGLFSSSRRKEYVLGRRK